MMVLAWHWTWGFTASLYMMYVCRWLRDHLPSSSLQTVPFRGPPMYNPKRRSGINWHSSSIGGLHGNGGVGGGGGGSGGSVCGSTSGSLKGTLTRHHYAPPSPCPSEHLPYSSASSSLSEGSFGRRSHEDEISIVTGIFIWFHFISSDHPFPFHWISPNCEVSLMSHNLLLDYVDFFHSFSFLYCEDGLYNFHGIIIIIWIVVSNPLWK